MDAAAPLAQAADAGPVTAALRSLDWLQATDAAALARALAPLDAASVAALVRRLDDERARSPMPVPGATRHLRHPGFADGRPVTCSLRLRTDLTGSTRVEADPPTPFRPEDFLDPLCARLLERGREAFVLISVGPDPRVLLAGDGGGHGRASDQPAPPAAGAPPWWLPASPADGPSDALAARLAAGAPFTAAVEDRRTQGPPRRVCLDALAVSSPSGCGLLWLVLEREAAAVAAERGGSEQRAKLAAIGELAAGIAHEINTPAQYVHDNLEFVQEATRDLLRVARAVRGDAAVGGGVEGGMVPVAAIGGDDDWYDDVDVEFLAREVPAACADALDGVRRIARIVSAMRNIAHPDQEGRSRCDVAALIDDAMDLTRGRWRNVAEVVNDVPPGEIFVWCSRQSITQCLMNFIVNAAQAIEAAAAADGARTAAAGRIVLAGRREEAAVVIDVSDNGPGVPPELGERIFEPFFTTKEVGAGTGQGLALVRQIVEHRHGGQVGVAPAPGGGSVFTLRLPVRRRDRDN